MTATFKTDPNNIALNPRKMLEWFCRETYPAKQNRAVVFVNSEFEVDTAIQGYSGKMAELVLSVHKAAETSPYYGLQERIIPVVIEDVDHTMATDLRYLVYNQTFNALWLHGELDYCTD